MNLKRGSEFHEELLSYGVSSEDLDLFLADGNSLKSSKCEKFSVRDLHQMFDSGGWIAGGAALSHIFKTHKASDLDIFFSDQIAYYKAVIMTRQKFGVDVCYSPGKPYQAFDLSVVKCSFKWDEFDIDESCLEAIESGVSDICPDAIINANATLRRMLKYNGYMGIRFRQEQVLAMCSVFSVDLDLAKSVLKNKLLIL
jgi:hypothetical protein